MYKPGGTIADALRRIQEKSYVLPAIQREFVWKPEQIERLFDSLMQGYPFGTFLFWKVNPGTSANFKFYDFVLNYHQRDAAHCPELPILHNQSVTAVLDGQQRLTALNIGLRGSMAIKRPHKWWTSPGAFPVRRLHLDLLSAPEPDDDGVRYRFQFLETMKMGQQGTSYWFPVGKIFTMPDGPAMLNGLMAAGLEGADLQNAYKILDKLHRIVHSSNLIHYFEEEDQDLERVLNIFIRLNSGGTTLSYSDLLLSIAVAQWKSADARSEIHKLVDELNATGAGFALSQDFVLKAGLMLTDIASVGFKVENFTSANMGVLEEKWPDVRSALLRTVELAATFGLNGQNLRADSALLPIAYYLYKNGSPENYATLSRFAADRAAIRDWLVRSLMKASGIWGSGLDTLLTSLREIIKDSYSDGFPAERLRFAMSQRGKSLSFEAAEIDELLDLRYGDRRTFALLSLLFPFVDLRNNFHVDHVFPSAKMTQAKLKRAGFEEVRTEAISNKVDQVPNLQLLEGAINNEKRATLPGDWLSKHFPSSATRANYCDLHDLGHIPPGLEGFEDFFAARRERMRVRLLDMLGAPVSDAPGASGQSAGVNATVSP